MKKTLIIFIILISVSNFSILAQIHNYSDLKKGVHVIFNDTVLMRNAPNTEGKVLYKLPITTKIEVIEKTTNLMKFDNYNDYWYKVKYINTEGYIWGGLIADNYYEGDIDSDNNEETFMILNNTTDPNIDNNNVYQFDYNFNNLKFRIARDTKSITDFILKSIYGVMVDTIKYEKCLQFNPSLQTVRIKYEFNGEVGGSSELFLHFNGNTLDSLFNIYYEKGEGGYVCYENAIFPNDKGGQTNTIIINSECGDESSSDEKNPTKWEYSQKILIWNGKKFTEKK